MIAIGNCNAKAVTIAKLTIGTLRSGPVIPRRTGKMMERMKSPVARTWAMAKPAMASCSFQINRPAPRAIVKIIAKSHTVWHGRAPVQL